VGPQESAEAARVLEGGLPRSNETGRGGGVSLFSLEKMAGAWAGKGSRCVNRVNGTTREG